MQLELDVFRDDLVETVALLLGTDAVAEPLVEQIQLFASGTLVAGFLASLCFFLALGLGEAVVATVVDTTTDAKRVDAFGVGVLVLTHSFTSSLAC